MSLHRKGKGTNSTEGEITNEATANMDPNIYDPEPLKLGDMIRAWPKNTFLIILNEFCERFSYYGMRAVLTLYFLNILKFDDDTSTILYHTFNVICYASPLIGSILADGYIGKFWTIFSVSIFYACGQIMLAVASTFNFDKKSVHPHIDLIGLMIIALGTGGIKPCVSAFGGDQFKPHYVAMISLYFSVFYFTINAGSTISSFISPIFRSQPCMGHDSCYPLSFGIPAVLMIVSVAIFMIGSPFYKKVPPKENTIARVLKTIFGAIRNRFRSNSPKREHWLDYAMDAHHCSTDDHCLELKTKDKCAVEKFVKDVKGLIRVMVMMLPVPMFWALYDQQGSRWVIQAVAMDAHISDHFSLLPDQMSTLNALLIMIFIPIFQIFVYPFVEKCGIRTTPLRRMIAGGFLAALAFVICGFVQIAVNETLPDVPKKDTAFVSVINAYPNNTCVFKVDTTGFESKYVNSNSSLIDNKVTKTLELYRIHVGSSEEKMFQITVASNSTNCAAHPLTITTTLDGGKSYLITITPNGYLVRKAKWDKPQEGEGQFGIGVNIVVNCDQLPLLNGTSCGNGYFNGSFAICEYDKPCDPKKTNKYYAWKSSDDKVFKYIDVKSANGKTFRAYSLDYLDVKPGTYKLYLVNYLRDYTGDHTPSASDIQAVPFDDVIIQIKKMGGVYSWTVSADANNKFITNIHTIVPDNRMNILWQVPQYFVITAAEILFSITGLEFAYAQSAPSMKAMVSALWLFTQAVGDTIIIIIAELDLFNNLAVEMFTYAGVMVIVVFVLMILSIFYYEYKTVDGLEDQSIIGIKEDSRNNSIINKDFSAFPNEGFDVERW